jgi:NADH-quinone oxidoreductase subunit N
MLNNFLYLMNAELLITIIIFILLFLKLSNEEWKNEGLLNFINFLLFINLAAGFFYIPNGNLFGDMFRANELLTFEKNLLNLGTLIISLQSYDWLKNHKHVPEFYMLLLSTLLGMFFMISSNNLLMFYLGLELSTIPLAALSNFDLDKRRSSEAAFKMIMSSAFSSGLLLFGISMLYGATGTLNFIGLKAHLNGNFFQVFSFILLLAGFGFKISDVPFHLWTADVMKAPGCCYFLFFRDLKRRRIICNGFRFYNVFSPMANSWYNMIFLISVATMIIGNHSHCGNRI